MTRAESSATNNVPTPYKLPNLDMVNVTLYRCTLQHPNSQHHQTPTTHCNTATLQHCNTATYNMVASHQSPLAHG